MGDIGCQLQAEGNGKPLPKQNFPCIIMSTLFNTKSDNGKGIQDKALNVWPGRDCHEQQVAPGRHPITACKVNNIGTWNVRTLYQAGKLENVKQEMERMKISIMGIAETRWTGKGLMKSGDKTFIYSGGKTHERGVGILFDQSVAGSIKGWWGVSDRVIVAKLEGKPFDIGIIQVYAPTSTYSDEELEAFYEDLEKAMGQLKSQDIKIVMGDFNAKIGNERSEDTVGPWGLGDKNERGERLLDWCRDNDFIITNTWYKHPLRRLYTWTSPDGKTRNQIDFILIQRRFRNAIKSVKTMPGADCESDHVPVISKMKLKLRKLKRTHNQQRFAIDYLKTNEKMKEQFVIDVTNRFQSLESITEAEELWDKMKDNLQEAMRDNIPELPRKKHKKWITNEILGLMDERRISKHNPDEYKRTTKEIRKKCKEAKEKWINDQCIEIELKQSTDSRYIHAKIKEISGKRGCSNSGCIKSKDGNILMDKKEILNRWSEYIEELFSDNRERAPVIKRELDGPPIMMEEVRFAIQKMKQGKATGPDNIPIEIILTMEDLGVETITRLLNSIYDSGEIPKDLMKSVFIALPKVPGATECELHRTISLMSHITKILLRVIIHRVRKSLRPEIARTQFGFVPDKGTRNAIFTISMLMERCIQVQKDLYICFIDYSKAFDKVKHTELFEILEKLDIDGKDLRIIRNLYWEQVAAVRIEGECSEYSNIKRGVRQGCVMSPDLFNLYSETILRNIENIPGVKINGENINNIRYADDTALIAGSEKDLQNLLDIVVKESENKGLSLNIKKTECMVVSKKMINPRCEIYSKGEMITQVQKFKYLGYMITSDGKCITEIKKRIGLAKNSFNQMKSLFTNHDITIKTKIRTLKTYVWSVLLYGCECWTISEDARRRLEAVEMWFLRRILKISWKDMRTNQSILEDIGMKRTVMKEIRKRQLKFLGHISRNGGLEHVALTGKIEGKKSRGRQRTMYLENVKGWTTEREKDNISFLRLAEDREEWRFMISNVCTRPGT